MRLRARVSLSCLATVAIIGGSLHSTPASASSIGMVTCTFDPLEGEPGLPPELKSPQIEGAALYITQFRGPVEEGWKREVESLGGTLEGYLPENAFIVRMTREASEAVRRVPAVRWVGLYHTGYRISPAIGRAEFVDPTRAADPSRTLLVLVAENVFTTVAAARAFGEVVSVADDTDQLGFVVHISPTRIAELAALPEVLWVEEVPEYRVTNSLTKWVIQSNVGNQTPVWNRGIYGDGQILCVMDTGLDYNSCWFREVDDAPPGPTHRKVIDYKTWGGNVYDGCEFGHGTHVTGTAVGDQSYINSGNTNYNGMAPHAKVCIQDVGVDNSTACSSGTVSPPILLTNAFTDAYNVGARVHTNSWGAAYAHVYTVNCQNVDSFMWSHPDFLLIYGAGNNGPAPETIASPGLAKDCVTVGATEQATHQDVVTSYSSRGPANDGRIKPTVMAPGGTQNLGIYSANNDQGNPPAETCVVQGSPTFYGTSMATPAVAGAALLIRDYFQQGFYPLGVAGGQPLAPSGALVKAMLVNSGRDMGTADQPNRNEGWGRILLDDALYFNGDARELRLEEESVGLATGETATYQYEVDGSAEPLEVTLVWSDYPASVGSNPSIVNNLDLTIQSPGGQLYRGNVYAGGESITGGTADNLNVEECVRRATPEVGTWTITVTAANVPQGGHQPFALVATGEFGNWPQPTAVGEPLPSGEVQLFPARPNPARGSATLSFRLNHAASVAVAIFDAAGRKVAVIVDGTLDAGEHAFTWDGRGIEGRPVATGVYYYRLTADGRSFTRKLVLAK